MRSDSELVSSGDVEIMQSLGVNAYRFSISWARILPRGRLGGVQSRWIAFLQPPDRCPPAERDTAVRHTAPFRHAARTGGPIRWLAGRRNPGRSSSTTRDVLLQGVRRPGEVLDDVQRAQPVHQVHVHAGDVPAQPLLPAVRQAATAAIRTGSPTPRRTNIIMSHAAAVRTYKEKYQAKQGGSIGIVIAMKWYEPLTNTTEDILAARRAQSFELEWFLDPIFFGDYPTQMREILKSNLPTFTSEEKKLLQYKSDSSG
ncbi:hypothetical protein PVAP13_7KG241110 [Panicum virgatum]|uniref:Uncharacterized protein n=1 Tax=Panicum virgatum TaxID=38727 RepID=A0A8T0QGW3_PANVG|nr:hypothetical protein PVAP13_7KG241110 [Panicum virgatum]